MEGLGAVEVGRLGSRRRVAHMKLGRKNGCADMVCVAYVTWVAVFVVLHLFGFLANINVKLISAANSIFGTSSMLTDSLHSKVSQLRGDCLLKRIYSHQLGQEDGSLVLCLTGVSQRKYNCRKIRCNRRECNLFKRNRAVNIMNLPIISKRMKKNLINDFGINTGHLATFVSHTNAINTIVKRQLKIGCIFEDDVTLKSGF